MVNLLITIPFPKKAAFFFSNAAAYSDGLIRPVFEDLHLFPGYGTLEWKPIFDALRDIRFRGVLNIEPVVELARMPRAVRVIQLRAASQTLQPPTR